MWAKSGFDSTLQYLQHDYLQQLLYGSVWQHKVGIAMDLLLRPGGLAHEVGPNPNNTVDDTHPVLP